MKTNFKRIGKQSISIVLAVMMMLSTMLVGTVTSNAKTDATATVYTTLDSISEFSSYINSDGSLKSGYTLKANTQYGESGDGATTWKLVDATKYTQKINGKTVYTADVGYYSDWNGLNTLQFQIYSGSSGSNPEKSVAIINYTWTDIATIKDKYWNGSSWVTPTWDSETSHTVTANFSNATVTLGGNTLTSGTPKTVDNNTDYTLTVTPDEGYTLTSVKFGDTEMGKSRTYTYNGSSDTTITIITEATSAPVAGNYIYFATPVSSSESYYLTTVNAYMWTGGIFNANWPGEQINTDKNLIERDYVIGNIKYNVYKISIEKDSKVFEYVIFNSGDKTTQSDDTKIQKGALYYISGENNGKYTLTNKDDYQPPVVKHSVKLAADSSANATVTVNNSELPVEVAENATYSLTVTPNENYYIKKITVGGEVKFTKTDDNYATAKKEVTIPGLTMGTADVEVKVEAAAAPVPVTLNATTVEDGAAYISSYTDNETGEVVTDATGVKNLQTVNAKPNTSVTFKAKKVNGYFPMWNVDGKKSTDATFTLDASYVTGTTGVTVYLTYEKIENHNLTITSGEGGSVSYTYNEKTGTIETGATSPAIPVASNKTITLTANADSTNSYVFKGWEFDSDAISYVSGDSLSATITISVVGNVNATATFEKNSGELTEYKFNMSTVDNALANDTTGSTATSYKVYKQADGTYTVTLPASEFTSSGNYYVSFSTDGKNNTLMPGNDISVKGIVDPSFTNYAKFVNIQEISQTWFYPSFSFQNREDITSVKFIYNPETKTYTVTGTYYTVPDDAHTVYATKGNTRSDGSMQYGTTTISLFGDGKIYKTKDNGSYNEYVVGGGNQITVECKVTDAQAKLGYYVYAFVVNGAKVDVIDTGNNVYQTTAPITVSSDLEITPVYYNKQIEADGNYVTIYTNAPKDLQDSWGNSISIYSWYDKGGAEMNGSYPGQLMMRDSQGKFGAKVPKYSYYEDPNGKYVPNTTQKVLGITNNNYSEKQVVHTKFLTTPETQKNHQTYDYDDFEKLTGLGYDTVQFDIKYFPTATDSNQHLLVKDVTNQPSNVDFIENTATPYENLTNIDGKPVSILGYTNDNAKANNKVGLITGDPLQIISVGNQSVKIGDKTTNEWSTIWYVYDSKGKYITQGLPSDFIPRGKFVDNKFVEDEKQTDAYNAIKDKNLEYNSAVISYEKEMDATNSTSGNNSGWRVDGRWYYARSTDKVDVNVGIIFRNSENDVWTVDKASDDKITGKVTGGSASFDYTDSVGASHTNLASASVERNTIITLNATNGTQYKFIGWGTPEYDADGKVTYNLTDLNATYTVGTNTKLFAMYEPYATGSVTITHSKYTGSDSHNGFGIFSVTAKVFDTNGKLVESQVIDAQSTSNTVTLKDIVNRNDDSYIEVTLTTQSYAKSHFLNFYYPSVSGGVSTLTKDGNIPAYYDKECTADNLATNTFTVKVSDLFDSDGKTQKVMALNYYSDLKLPEVESNITFNYNPYSTAPNPNPDASKGTGKTTFTLTITKNDGSVVYTSNSDISSLTLKGNAELKEILADLTNNDYTITITMNPLADSHCDKGATYRQTNTDGAYTYTEASSDTVWKYNTDTNTYSASLSDLFDITTQKFKTNTINLYTDFTAKEFSYNVKFKYLGYESREYYNKYGFTQDEIPEGNIQNNWRKTYTASGKFYGADIDKYYNSDTKTFNESFLLKVAPYEDNFVQSITWDLKNAACSESNDGLSVEATVFAKYKNDSVTVTADFGDGEQKQTHTVNYASLVTNKNLVGSTTQSANDEEYLFVAPETKDGKKFSYWTIQTDDSNGIEVAKCYSKEFNFIAYDNYLITACYGEDVEASKKGLSATMQFLEYSRNQYDTGKDRVYADFAVAYNYNNLLLQKSNNSDIVCGVAFVLNSKYKSTGNAVDTFNVNPDDLYAKVRALNEDPTTNKKLADGSKVFNYVIDKKNLDNKNRIEYNWSVDNLSANQQLTLLAYSYIYDKSTGDYYSVSAPQAFKFYEVGNKSYETQE
ncbi:hypothetical protein [Ruminococcus sp.]